MMWLKNGSQDDVSEWIYMSLGGLLAWYKTDIIISSNSNLFL